MIESFRKLNKNVHCGEVISINTDTLEIKQFNYNLVQDGTKIIFSEYNTNLHEKGYKTVNDYIKRLKELAMIDFNIDEIEIIPIYDMNKYSFEERKNLYNRMKKLELA